MSRYSGPVLRTLTAVAAAAMAGLSPLAAQPPAGAGAGAIINEFGIHMAYPTRSGSREWNSLHWASGGPRVLSNRDTPFDPTGWSQKRGTGILTIDGQGILRFNGTQPRLYINPYPNGSSNPNLAAQRFRDVEVSVYFRRLHAGGAGFGGLIVGVRSGPMGHGAAGGNDCDATTYYARLRNDGNWDFAKELKHPAAANILLAPAWAGQSLPVGQWIGLRYAVHTVAGGHVRLELWVDRNSAGAGGGNWESLGSYTDSGQWNSDAPGAPTDATGCAYPNDQIVEPGGGVVLLRNSSSESVDLSEYRWLSVREIVAPDSEHLFANGFQ